MIYHLRDVTETYETNMHEVVKALEQAQKQEKLLKLYQRLYKDFDDLTLDEQLEIEKRIKEIENEKSEMSGISLYQYYKDKEKEKEDKKWLHMKKR